MNRTTTVRNTHSTVVRMMDPITPIMTVKAPTDDGTLLVVSTMISEVLVVNCSRAAVTVARVVAILTPTLVSRVVVIFWIAVGSGISEFSTVGDVSIFSGASLVSCVAGGFSATVGSGMVGASTARVASTLSAALGSAIAAGFGIFNSLTMLAGVALPFLTGLLDLLLLIV